MFRRANDDDKDMVLAWRNHVAVREASLTQDVISPEEHARYWSGLATNATRQVFIYEEDDVPSGVVTFSDIDGDRRSATLGYFLDNDGLQARGELLPVWIRLHTEAVTFGFDELGLEVIDGEVLDDNPAVRRLNKRNGFVDVGSEERQVGGRTVTVHKIQARRPTRG